MYAIFFFFSSSNINSWTAISKNTNNRRIVLIVDSVKKSYSDRAYCAYYANFRGMLLYLFMIMSLLNEKLNSVKCIPNL